MKTGKLMLCAGFAGAMILAAAFPAKAGLDLQNQREIALEWLDLDRNGRVTRAEVGEYLFFYFDRDGNESLSLGEYDTEREIAFLPHEGAGITHVDIDQDGADDGTDFTLETFLQKAMIGGYDPDDDGIKGEDVLDENYLRADSDRSKYVELDEWQKIYAKGAVKKGNFATEEASQDRYRK